MFRNLRFPLARSSTSSPATTTSLTWRSQWIQKYYSTSSAGAKPQLTIPDHLNDQEKGIFKKLAGELKPTRLEVKDVSGGCGSMYAIEIASERFVGLSLVRQHRLVHEILGEEVKAWHGVQLRTSVA
ncbi:bola-like protein [Choiromyces venosus 120613-1]|uniref:Bola-like protein n=1 Tax=Choiromyces venosus 120613-1 TaxID=1336337 RepID=A0A3N4JYZ9_9PEZI|nr:bola-like protein [Choiromyces venosus 120613-1]